MEIGEGETSLDETQRRGDHWSRVYRSRAVEEVSWFQPSATTSLEMLLAGGVSPDASILDVGAGSSTLADGLVARGFRDVTLLEIAPEALAATRARVGDRVELHYEVADVLAWRPPRRFAAWHDRAVFHFLTDDADRAAYRRVLDAAVAPGGVVVIATFALDGPERCSGLPVRRYSPETLAEELSGLLRAVDSRREVHRAPGGKEQAFTFVRFERTKASLR
jgi:2-polyprenyl-3-methyl-5-hydroxy-6-metoxy-1,4-benzoquinol methylase